jgi:hypothetical protein
MFIQYLDAPAGAGKTFAIVSQIGQLVEEGDNVLLCQPTKALIKETAAQLTSRFPSIHHKVFHSEPGKESIVGEIVRHFKNPPPEPQVVIITWEALQRLPFIENQEDWHLIVDEIPQAYSLFDEVVPETHGIVTDHLKLRPFDSKYSSVTGNHAELRKLADNENGDKALEVFQPLARRLVSNHWRSYVQTDSYERLLSSTIRAQRLTVFSFLNCNIFERFKSVTVAGACFQDSIFYKSFSACGVRFVESKEAKQSLRYVEHQNGGKVTFLWATDRPWSKKLRDSGDIWSKIVEGVRKEFGGSEFLWSANKDMPDDLFQGCGKAVRLPQSPHGLNHYQHIDNAVFLSAHNLTPAHAKSIQDLLDMDRSEVVTAVHGQIAYQAVMRGSLRDPKNTNHKKVFVPDQHTAHCLHQQFPGSKLQKLDCGLNFKPLKRGRPKTHSSAAERDKAYRERQEQKRQEWSKALVPNVDGESQVPDVLSDENALFKSNFVDRFRASVFRTKMDKEAFMLLETDSVLGFEEGLKVLSKRMVANKEHNVLFCPAVFDAELSPEKSRGKDNFVTATGIWLDFDGGDLRPKDFTALFPKLRMTAYATFSSTKADQRFRVFIPTSHQMTYDLYVAITGHIRAVLVETGYPLDKKTPGDKRKAHGLDGSKLTPISLFYAPCNPEDPSGRFFKTFKDKGRQPLNVMEWIGKVDIPDEPFVFEPPQERQTGPVTRNGEKVTRAINAWIIQSSIPGVGHGEFWRLACRLAKANCDEYEVHSILMERAGLARHPHERRSEIPGILRELTKKGWFNRPWQNAMPVAANKLAKEEVEAANAIQPASAHHGEGLLRFFESA